MGQNGIHPACTCAIDVCYGGFVVVKKFLLCGMSILFA